MTLSVHTLLEALLFLINCALVFIGLKVKADISEMKVFMFERFVTKGDLEQRLADYREERRTNKFHTTHS